MDRTKPQYIYCAILDGRTSDMLPGTIPVKWGITNNPKRRINTHLSSSILGIKKVLVWRIDGDPASGKSSRQRAREIEQLILTFTSDWQTDGGSELRAYPKRVHIWAQAIVGTRSRVPGSGDVFMPGYRERKWMNAKLKRLKWASRFRGIRDWFNMLLSIHLLWLPIEEKASRATEGREIVPE